MKKMLVIALCIFMVCGCSNINEEIEIIKDDTDMTNIGDTHFLRFEDNKVFLDDEVVNEYEYIWNINIETGEEEYSGTYNQDDVYLAHDIVYYPLLDESEFKLENYNGETEWVRYYQNDELKNYIFSTLPNLKNGFPSDMMHSAEEAYNNPVLHITKSGTYVLNGTFNGQIYVDLGEEAYCDETQTVTLILDDIDVKCTVAPALIFKNVYETDNAWEEKASFDDNINLENAGATVIIKDGSVNNFVGTNVFRLLKPVYKKEGSNVQKKLYKMDGAFYSFESMLIKGEEKGNGILNITSTTFEGLNSELHLQINSGNINIVSNDDGINVNEDDVSVFVMNDGRLTIFAGLGSEGDVIDSNGFIKINGGTILGTSPSISDNILDSDAGTTVSDEATIIVGGAMSSNFNEAHMNFNKGEFFDRKEGFDPNSGKPEDFGRRDFNGFERPEGTFVPGQMPNQ